MSDFNDLIHDARQIDLEEIIVTKPTYYLVPANLTRDQEREFFSALSPEMGEDGRLEYSGATDMIAAVGAPIQPCADVETVANAYEQKWTYGDEGSIRDRWQKGVSLEGEMPAMPIRDVVPLVRRVDMAAQVAVRDMEIERLRTDMEAQVARVAAEKDAEIARLRKALTDLSVHIDCGCMPCTGQCWDKQQLRDELADRVNIARAALNEGAAG